MPRNVPTWVWAWVWVMAGFALAVVVGFGADPVPQPQRVSDLVARLDALEATNAEQAAAIESLMTRVERLEQSAGITQTSALTTTSPQTGPPPPAGDDTGGDTGVPTVPESWAEGIASDGILTYRYDPRWEIALDEPGTVNFWVDDEYALFYSWDWPSDLLETLQDEAFLELFEEDLYGDESTEVEVVDSGPTMMLGMEGYFWEMALEFEDGLDTQILTIMYACNERVSCNVTLVRAGRNRGFDADDRAVLELFVQGVAFLNVGKVTVTANANLRACPSIDCEIVGRALHGEIIEVVGKSGDAAWYRLRSGAWIAASLVEGAPNDLPVLDGGSEL